MTSTQNPAAAGETPVRELRSAELTGTQVSGRTVSGYAAVYDTPWNDWLTEQMGYVEKVARGAFRKALSRTGNVPLLWQHDRNQMLATTKGNTLRLREDGKGLYFEADLPDTQLGNDVREMIKRGDVQGMSYGIASLRSDSLLDRRTTPPTRLVQSAQRLLDVTLTYEPAYEAATVELRNAGFAALPLQEISAGSEEQIAEAAGEVSSQQDDVALIRRRMAEVRLSILEKGGTL